MASGHDCDRGRDSRNGFWPASRAVISQAAESCCCFKPGLGLSCGGYELFLPDASRVPASSPGHVPHCLDRPQAHRAPGRAAQCFGWRSIAYAGCGRLLKHVGLTIEAPRSHAKGRHVGHPQRQLVSGRSGAHIGTVVAGGGEVEPCGYTARQGSSAKQLK